MQKYRKRIIERAGRRAESERRGGVRGEGVRIGAELRKQPERVSAVLCLEQLVFKEVCDAGGRVVTPAVDSEARVRPAEAG